MMRKRIRAAVGAVSFAVCAVAVGSAGPAQAASSVGVAPFEKSGSGEPPDIATRLADRLTTAGVACTGPDQIGIPAVARTRVGWT